MSILELFTSHKLSDETIVSSGVCQNCFIKFNDYDEHANIAQTIQEDILLMYDSALEEEEIKPDIKLESYEQFGIAEVMLEDDDEPEQATDIFRKIPKRSKSPRNSDRRPYKRKKNLDEGLTVVEVDGAKIYQCDICQKLCKDRYKLKTHREIHTTERTVCCNECGAMFKTLTCLYSHKKIHRERIYHQWWVVHGIASKINSTFDDFSDHCEMRYIQKTQLRKHMDAIHLKKKEHICSICGELLRPVARIPN